MARKPDLQASHVGVLADLHLTLEDGPRTASAHLTGGPDELILDVDHPVVMLRAARRRYWPQDFPVSAVERFAGTSLRVRWQGTTVGRIWISSGGRPRFRPSLAALTLPGRSAIQPRNARIIAGASLALIGTGFVIGRFRRR